MSELPVEAIRLTRPFEVGEQVAQGRRRSKVSQADFARKLGVSRKTISDLERGAVEHISLKTAMAALALAGFALYSARRRPPTMEEITARRSADRARAEGLLEASGGLPPGPLAGSSTASSSAASSSPSGSSTAPGRRKRST
jgi:DNA-binding XRE family transcriptional regulator